MRFLLLASLCLPFAASAGAGDPCDDDFNECKESCLIEFGGSIRDDVKKKYGKCMKKCTKTSDLCTERSIETRTNNLDEGALDKSPGSREVDENGMPDRTTGKPKKTADGPVQRDDDVRAADSRRDKPAKTEKPEKAEKPKREEPRDEETPKSTRTKLDKVEPTKAEKTEKPREERAEAPREEIKVELKPERQSRNDEDLRDDGPRREEAKPKKREEPRREEPPPPPPPKKKEEDHDDLRNY